MKRLLLVALCFEFIIASGQEARNFRVEASHLKRVLLEKHVSPRPFNDALSSEIFDLTLSTLDPQKIHFTNADIQWLEPYRNLIDDEIAGKNWAFMSRLKERYESCLKRTQGNIRDILKTDPDFNAKESFDGEADTWAKDEGALRTRQRLWLKSKVLDKIADMARRDSISCTKAIAIHKTEATLRIQRAELMTITNLLTATDKLTNYVGGVFLGAITGVFDPHTLYFSPSELKSFIGELATEDYYFGFTLGEDALGKITIASLAPGSPAWNSGELHVNDILLSFQPEGSETVELEDVTLEDANQLVSAIETDVSIFTVRKKDGVEKHVRLRKERMTAEENFVRSFVLSGEKKFGYIHLPDFYTRWGDEASGSRCANDVAREILNLKKDGIEGLIVDLRFNGGGSLYEAMAMAGIFIDEGPLGILRDRERTTSLKDVNRGTVYDGPLVILVNGQSASASEFLAAAIQDYNRGLVVGSRTYGKATGQNILPLSPLAKQSDLNAVIDKSEGFIKITTERLYRVTGKSLQGHGVSPDIALPDLFTVLGYHESDVPFSLSPDSVDKKTYYKPLTLRNKLTVQSNSQTRVNSSPFFTQMSSIILALAARETGDHSNSLYGADFCADEVAAGKLLGNIEREPVAPVFEVMNNSTEQQRLKVDSYADEYNKRWFEKLSGDLYLRETYFILSDLSNPKKP